MSLKKFLALTDIKLADKFHETPPDTDKLRKAAVKKIDKAIEQFSATEPARGRKMFKANNAVVELQLPFAVELETLHYVPSERLLDALNELKAGVEAGEADDALIAAANGGEVEAKPKRQRKTSGGGAGWSQERRDRFAATVAARKAAKQN